MTLSIRTGCFQNSLAEYNAAMPRKQDHDMYSLLGALHYNIQLKGGALNNRVTARGFEGPRPADIEWVWIVEEKRRATPDEIRKLCKGGARR